MPMTARSQGGRLTRLPRRTMTGTGQDHTGVRMWISAAADEPGRASSAHNSATVTANVSASRHDTRMSETESPDQAPQSDHDRADQEPGAEDAADLSWLRTTWVKENRPNPKETDERQE